MAVTLSSSSLLLPLLFVCTVYKEQQTGKAPEFIHSGPNFSSEMSQLIMKDKAKKSSDETECYGLCQDSLVHNLVLSSTR